jgi:cobalt transporter subunit CbtA
MLTRMLAAGLLAGVFAGILVSGLQHGTTVPLILKAETYEKSHQKAAETKAAPSSFQSHRNDATARLILVHGGEDHADIAADKAWSPSDGLERTLATSVSTIGAAVGFAMMLLAGMIAAGVTVTPQSAVLWGVAGFFATGLAPSLGLPPGLPGGASADLVQSQIWWGATAAATALGIWLLFKPDGATRVVAALALIAAPHIIGAPQAAAFTSTVPAELAGHFASASLAVHAVLWVLTGALAGYFWTRMNSPVPGEVG